MPPGGACSPPLDEIKRQLIAHGLSHPAVLYQQQWRAMFAPPSPLGAGGQQLGLSPPSAAQAYAPSAALAPPHSLLGGKDSVMRQAVTDIGGQLMAIGRV